ncbi:MAG: diacylglycerol kinase family protein [Patescibacteria group bacterium]|jgi:diacylglycerol kinase family enzyme
MQTTGRANSTYTYFFDQFLREKKYETDVHRIESRILELGLNGKIEKLSVLTSAREMLKTAISRGAQTIVAVGNDHTLSKVVDIIAGEKVILGFIPVGDPHETADMLGIPTGVSACDVLSHRIIMELDMGEVNDLQHFLFSVEIPSNLVEIECDGKYTVRTKAEGGQFSIHNFGLPGGRVHNPADGLLETVITRSKKGMFSLGSRRFEEEGVFPVKKVKVSCAGDAQNLLLDGTTIVKTPATVKISAKKLKIIVGKGRQF